MFVETIRHAAGTTQGTATEAHTLMLLRRALQQGSTVEATRDGGAHITWTRPAGTSTTAIRFITLTPAADPAPLDETILPYLAVIASGEAWADTRTDGSPVIRTFLNEVTPGAAARLRARQLVTEQGAHHSVRLTLSGGLGLVAAHHRTTTAGTRAACSCGFSEHHHDPASARVGARGHLRQVTAAFVTRLGPAFTSAVAATR